MLPRPASARGSRLALRRVGRADAVLRGGIRAQTVRSNGTSSMAIPRRGQRGRDEQRPFMPAKASPNHKLNIL